MFNVKMLIKVTRIKTISFFKSNKIKQKNTVAKNNQNKTMTFCFQTIKKLKGK